MQSMTAITSYSDYSGTISIDNDGRKDAYTQLAEDNDIDLSNQYLVGIKFEKIELESSQFAWKYAVSGLSLSFSSEFYQKIEYYLDDLDAFEEFIQNQNMYNDMIENADY